MLLAVMHWLEHLTSELSLAAWLLVTRLCSIYLVGELVLVSEESKDKIMLQCFREMECKQSFTTETSCKRYNVSVIKNEDL